MKKFGKFMFFPKYGNSLYEASNYYPKPISLFRCVIPRDDASENAPYKCEKSSETKCSKNSDGLSAS